MLALSSVDVCGPQTQNTSLPTDRDSLRTFLNAFVKQCNIQYQGTEPPVADFEALCISEASARGYLEGDDGGLRRAMGVGATIAATSYSHLSDEGVKMYIALYTGFVTYLDDTIVTHLDAVREFVARFVARRPQRLKMLDDLAAVLLDMPKFHNEVACNIILTSTFDFISSLLIQCDVLGVPIPTSAPDYPMFFRRMSGLGNCYAAFVFPRDIPVQHWVYSLPDVCYCICTINDILSFYKEDLDGEVVDTLLWLIARNRNISVYESLRDIANETVDTHNRALRTLEPFPDAYEAYRKFSDGFHGFHLESKRYRLQELKL